MKITIQIVLVFQIMIICQRGELTIPFQLEALIKPRNSLWCTEKTDQVRETPMSHKTTGIVTLLVNTVMVREVSSKVERILKKMMKLLPNCQNQIPWLKVQSMIWFMIQLIKMPFIFSFLEGLSKDSFTS